jgi:hypothetical protein
MRHRTATATGRALYKLRQQTVEPVFGIIFGIIEAAMGFRRFSLREHRKVSLESDLVCLAYNVKRLHRLGAALGGTRVVGRVNPLAPGSSGRFAVRNPAQSGFGGAFIGFKPTANRLLTLWARHRLRHTNCRADISSPGFFLSPTDC